MALINQTAYNLSQPITKSDTVNILPIYNFNGTTSNGNWRPTDAIYVGGAGDVNVVLPNGQTQLFSGAVAGSILPVKAIRVNSTSTTATLLQALWVN